MKKERERITADIPLTVYKTFCYWRTTFSANDSLFPAKIYHNEQSFFTLFASQLLSWYSSVSVSFPSVLSTDFVFWRRHFLSLLIPVGVSPSHSVNLVFFLWLDAIWLFDHVTLPFISFDFFSCRRNAFSSLMCVIISLWLSFSLQFGWHDIKNRVQLQCHLDVKENEEVRKQEELRKQEEERHERGILLLDSPGSHMKFPLLSFLSLSLLSLPVSLLCSLLHTFHFFHCDCSANVFSEL